jgi:hypothetical protein
MIRHGDILLCEYAEALWPRALRENQPVSSLTLATGETTGHAHVLEGSILSTTLGSRMFLRLLEPGTLRHEEHHTLTVPPGDYEVVRQRVYTGQASDRYVLD